ncbi:PEP-CTERM sorting domain-containing protein [Thalassotalea profundi]|uniref:Ice-binding protein C-terminal domain-containing protein n=1 Tax=Thalassotalea profundi TaxID=2036687 RepID=A0ABQ3IN03_9GAMM|nr:PEP-CTERM sorting domain-containing protein [Thalassotalea profundi]GHE84363.1 hypothetical protein GCM10011501_11310 [Thalassotalea profundi]
MLKKILCSALFISQVLLSHNSFAGLIELEVDQSSYQVNDTVTAKIIVSDFSHLLSAAYTELVFDDNAISLIDWQFSNVFDDGLGSYQYADDSGIGTLFLEDYADIFADIATLTAQQGTSFVFATVQFKLLSEGLFQLGFNSDNSGLLSIDNDFVQTSYAGAIINVGPVTSVPEPSTLILMFLGAIGLVTLRKN